LILKYYIKINKKAAITEGSKVEECYCLNIFGRGNEEKIVNSFIEIEFERVKILKY